MKERLNRVVQWLQHNGSYYLKFLAVVVLIHALYWLVLRPILGQLPNPENRYPIAAMEIAQLDAANAEALANAEFEPMEPGWYGCCDLAYYAARATVTMGEPIPQALAYLPRINADNALLYVNGVLAATGGNLDMNLEHPPVELLRQAWFVPGALLKPGDNYFDLITVRTSMPYTDISSPWLGEYQDFKQSVKHREFILGEYLWISISISWVLALMSATLYFRGGKQQGFIWICLLLLAWGGRLQLQLWTMASFPLALRVPLSLGYEIVMALSWCNFANEWSQQPYIWMRKGSLYLTAAALAGIAACQLLAEPERYDTRGTIVEYVGLVLIGAAVLRFAWHILRNQDARMGEAAVFTLLATFLGMDFYSELTTQLPNGNVRQSLPLVFVAFAMAFLSRNIHLFRSLNEFNQLLSTQLAAREKQLADSFEERQEVTRQQALLEERKRIMRDMHDGMGGRLMSLAAQLRSTTSHTLNRDELADDLMTTLDELRLIVDSLDTAGDDLGMALGAFRARMQPKLESAGINTHWAIDDEAASASLSAGNILNIYRIMQEACANMLRHADAHQFSVSLGKAEDGSLQLEMADDGRLDD